MAIQVRAGKLEPIQALPLADPAVQFGAAGFFESIRVEGRGLALFDDHMRRLGRSLAAWRIGMPDMGLLNQAIRHELDQWVFEPELRLRVTVGPDPDERIGADSGSASRAWVTADPLPEAYRGGIDSRRTYAATVFQDFRAVSGHPLAGHKSRQYWLNWEARRRAEARGFDEAILLNESGEVAEAAAFNIFWIADGRFRTPSRATGCLPGVFADRMKLLLARAGIPCEDARATPAEVMAAESAFLTNALAEIMPLGSLDDRTFIPMAQNPLGARAMALAEADRSARIDARL